ncbi:MAG TPA: hypothetical protein DHW82_04685 [Spirochaetia bacterium]|nr:hypothetical protein [Spirochaetia bacterium]
MKRTILFFIWLSQLLFIQTVFADIPKTYQEALDKYKKGHEAFAKLEYKKAIQFYTDVESFIDKNPKFKPYFDHHFRNFSMIEMVREREKLSDIRPLIEHKIGIFYIKHVDAEFEGKKIKTDFTGDLKETAELSQDVAKRLIEILSRGQMTLSFERIEIEGAFTDLSLGYASVDGEEEDRGIVQAVVESIKPYPWQTMLESLSRYDTFVFYWNDNRLKVGEKGGAKALGGAARIPVVPFISYGPIRGRIIISVSLADRPGTFLHELFHTLEKCYQINPIHGFWDSNRKNFPDWSGQGEFDYYRYHFQKILKKQGLQIFQFISRFPSSLTEPAIKKIFELSSGLSYDNLKQAAQYFSEGAKIQVKNEAEAINLYQKTLDLNPYHTNALLRIAAYYHKKNEKDKAFEYSLRAYQIDPFDSEICYWMGVGSFHQKKYKEAVLYLSEGLKNDENSLKLYQYRGFVYYQTKDYSKAMEDFKMLLKLNKGDKKWLKSYLDPKKKTGDKEAVKMMKNLGI